MLVESNVEKVEQLFARSAGIDEDVYCCPATRRSVRIDINRDKTPCAGGCPSRLDGTPFHPESMKLAIHAPRVLLDDRFDVCVAHVVPTLCCDVPPLSSPSGLEPERVWVFSSSGAASKCMQRAKNAGIVFLRNYESAPHLCGRSVPKLDTLSTIVAIDGKIEKSAVLRMRHVRSI